MFDASMHERGRELVDEHATESGQAEREVTDELEREPLLGQPGQHDLEHRRIVGSARRRLFGRGETVQIGRYRVERRIGAGGMGEVYLAHDDELGRKVAVKRVRTSLDRPQVQERLRREARALARLSHPNVVQVYEFGVHEARTFVAMEFVDGRTLGAALREGRLGWRAVLELFVAAGRGLAAVHAAGLVHRDFKPDNVLLSHDGRVLVADFGLVIAGEDRRVELSDDVASLDADTRTSVTGAVLGTIRYMPLEQLRATGSDARSDQFSFCVSLYEALWSQPPFVLETVMTRLRALENDEPRPPRARAGLHPPMTLWRVLRRGLARDPDQRWPDMPALLDALERALPDHRRRRRRLAWAASLALAFVGAWQMRAEPPQPIDMCAAVEHELVGTWDASRRATLERALEHADARERVLAGLDRWAAGWVTRREQVCRSAATPSSSPELARLQVTCLTRQRERVDDLVVLLAGPSHDADLLAGAVEAVAELPSAASCDDELDLIGIEPVPTKLEREVEQVRRDLDKSATLRRLGRLSEGIELAEQSEQRAATLGYAPLHAEALAELAHAELDAGSLERGVERLEQAIDAAELARHEALAAELWTSLALHSLVELEDPRSGTWQLRRADVAQRRIAAGPRAQTRLTYGRGMLAALRGDDDDAEQQLRTALAAALDDPGMATEVPIYRISLADVVGRRDLDARDRLFRAALVDAEQTFGRTHPLAAYPSYRLALGLREREPSNPEIAPLLQHAVDVWQQHHRRPHNDLARAEYLLGVLAMNARDYAGALAHARAAARLHDEVLPASHLARASTAELLGVLLSVQGEPAAAVEEFTRALAISRPQLGIDDPSVQRQLANLAASLLALGRLDEADAALAELLPVVTGVELVQVRLQRCELALRRARPLDARAELDRLAALPPESLGGHAYSLALLDALVDLRTGRRLAAAKRARLAAARASTPFTSEQIAAWLDQLELDAGERATLEPD